MGSNDPWIRGAAQDQLSVWGVQPPPGLARQYATTRHGDRGGNGLVSASTFLSLSVFCLFFLRLFFFALVFFSCMVFVFRVRVTRG